MRGLGYLPGELAEWDAALLMEHMRSVAWWLAAEEPLRLQPDDLWRGADSLRDDRGQELLSQLRRMTLPPEALLLRRMEGLLFQIATQLRAAAPWGALMERAGRRRPARRRARRRARRLAGPATLTPS